MNKINLITIVSTIIIPTIIIIVFVLPGFLGPSEAVQNGPLVIGTIVDVKQTGNYFNYNPELEITFQFTTDDGKEITTSTREYVAMIDLAQFQRGAFVPLRYNPENPEEIMMVFGLDDETLQKAMDKKELQNGTNWQQGQLLK